ncbi:MFS transporter [Microtetraspora sp. NBRC 13810]|uniref:MFS transporter n=1 Tax=Microtetraspora sp. NBRC 13810 TaxID=3030990 RepID=UPI0024A26B73|nr:MFS transporter [Microtetraspora sp. NBRC 13810]GLW07398.1 MFS transporter [Microtetraspora sp. NBRC 13810]
MSPRSDPPDHHDRRTRLATFAVFFVQGLTLATLLAQIATLQGKHRLSDGELSILLLVVPVVAGVGSVLAGALATRHGSRTVLRVAQPLACVAVVLAGLASNVPQLVAANVVFGLGLGSVDAGMNMQGVTVERRYGRPVLTGFHASWSAAAVLAALWASFAGSAGLGLPVTFGVAMAIGVVISALAVPHLYGTAEEHVTSDVPGAPAGSAPVAWRAILPLCLAMAALYVGDASVSNFGSVFMDTVLNASAAVIPLALAAYQATTFAVRAGGDLAVGRFGPAVIVRIGGVVAALGFAVVVIAPNEPLAIAGFALTGVGLSVVAPQSFSAAGRLDPAGSGVAIARVNMFNYVGFIVGAALVGGIAEAADYRVAFVAPLALAALIVLLARGFDPRRAPAGPRSERSDEQPLNSA